MVWYSIVYPFGWWFQICFFPPEKGDDDPKVMSMLSPSYPQYTTITAASRPGTRVRMSYPPQEPSLISLFCGFFKSRKKQTTYIYIYILIWSVGQLGLSKIRIVRILDPVPKNANLSRWGSDIRDMAAATESWRPKRTASLRLQNGQNHRPESLVKITCNYRHYIRKISKQKVLLIGQLSYKKLGCLLCLKRPDVAHFVFPHCWFLGKPWL